MEVTMRVSNWEHNSGKRKQTRGMCKGRLKARKQSLQALKNKLKVRETAPPHPLTSEGFSAMLIT
jgi:hypothetical protein